MLEESQPSTPESALFALAPLDPEWRPILHATNQVVLYNPTSHALSIRHHRTPSTPKAVVKHSLENRCPYCHRNLPRDESSDEDEAELELVDSELEEHPRSRVPNYFQLLQVANDIVSAPSTPSRRSSPLRTGDTYPDDTHDPRGNGEQPFRADSMAEGYFKAFFQEECRLGMGANGSVYLCQHVLDGNPLGHFAVKKIAVGQSHSYLLNTLREVRLLEKLHHPNIIQYHHSWLESSQFSTFGPKVPTLHVLMQWAEGGSLDDFIDVRLGRRSPAHAHPASHSGDASPQTNAGQPLSRGARIRAFRAMQRASPEEREKLRGDTAGDVPGTGASRSRDWKAVHLLSAEEVKSLFQDIVEGLSFLHDKSILHLDLKPGNVLLTWEGSKLIPRAMLSDFGTSQDMLNSRARSGNTGTLEYASPESLPNPSGLLTQVDSKADIWSLGMILHKLLFFQLPYKHASGGSHQPDSKTDGKAFMDLLEKEVLNYPGFKSSRALETKFVSRRLPMSFLVLLETLLHVKPALRPTSERIVTAIREGRFDPVATPARRGGGLTSLIPALRTPHFDTPNGSSPERLATPTELPIWTESDAQGASAQEDQRKSFLGLPALPEPHEPEEFEYMKLRLWNTEYRLTRTTAKLAIIRTIKSVLLVLKVRALAALYDSTPGGRTILACALGLAFVDTWSERLTVSFALGVVHAGLVGFARWMN